jgi:hypothetical protein
VQDHVAALLRFIGSVGNLSLLTTCDYYFYYNSYDKMMEKEMVTRQRYGMGIDWCSRLCPAATGYSLVALFFLPVSVKDRPLFGPWSSHRLIIPSTYLFMGAGRFVTLLSWAPALFRPTDWRRGQVEV